MAFGYPPRHTQDFKIENLSINRILVLAVETVEKLGWNIGTMTEDGFSAYTKFSMSSWSEEVQFKIDFHNINIKSECVGSQLIDWGKNKSNIEKFIQTFEAIKGECDLQALDNKYRELEQKFELKEEGQMADSPQPKKIQINGFLSIFQARHGYFVTPTILVLNVMIFIIMIMLGVDVLLPDGESLILWGANFRPATLDGGWWRLITSCFIHIGIIHLLMNMYALVYIGMLLEPYLGKVRFLSAYMLTGVAGSLASLYWNELTISAGASGAIFGMYGVFLAMLTTNLIEKSARQSILTSILFFVGYNLLNGLKGGIDNAAHLGGLTSGILIGYAFYPSLTNPKNVTWKTATLVLLTGITLSASYFFLTHTSNDILKFEKSMEKFASLESMALEVYSMPEGTSDEDLLAEIQNRGIYYWEECIALVRETDQLDLPQQLHDQNSKLIKYCELRIESYAIIHKAITENSDKYQAKIEDYNFQIESILKELQQNE